MPKPSTKARSLEERQAEVELRMTTPHLWRLQFEKKPKESPALAEPADMTKIEVHFGLQLARVSMNGLGVELSATVDGHPDATMEVAFRARYMLAGSWKDLAPDELESRLGEIARGVAPAALYPYLREALGSASARAGIEPILLPIVDFRSFFASEEVEVPPASEGATRDETAEPDKAEPATRKKRKRST